MENNKYRNAVKRIVITALTLTVLTGCSESKRVEEIDPGYVFTPSEKYDTLEEAESAAGFNLEIPESINDYYEQYWNVG